MHNKLKVLRAERNWSQAELADRLSVSRQTVNALETGKYDPACRWHSRSRTSSNFLSRKSSSTTLKQTAGKSKLVRLLNGH